MGETRYRATVNQSRCIGCGLCEETMPDVFRLGDYTAWVVEPEIPGDRHDELAIVTRDCPVNAISVVPVSGVAASGQPPGYDHEERQNEENGGEIREYKRKHGHLSDGDEVQADHTKRLKGGKHDFSIVRNGTNDD